eukprot:2458285-Pleurochrysis_carterae.AAC.1
MEDGMIPEPNRAAAGDECGTGKLHHRPDCSFCHPVQLMNVGGASRRVHFAIGEEVSEFTRYEFSSVIAMQTANDPLRLGCVLVGESGEGCKEVAHAFGCFRFVTQEVNGLVPRVVVDENEGVLKTSVRGARERASNV